MSRTTTVEHGGTTYYGRVAAITSTHLGKEDHGILSAYLTCQGDGWSISVGGYALDTYDRERDRRIPTAYGLDHLVQIMRAVGVDRWESIPRTRVLVLFTSPSALGATAVGIAHIQDDERVLIFADHAAEWAD